MMISPVPRQSLQVFMANSRLSVPQLVTFPTHWSSPLKRLMLMRTTSFQMTLRELKTTGFRALECIYFTKHSSVSFVWESEWSYTQAKVLPALGSTSALILLSRIPSISSRDRPFLGSWEYSQTTALSFNISSVFLVASVSSSFSILELKQENFLENLTAILVTLDLKPVLPRDLIPNCVSWLRRQRARRRMTKCSSMRQRPSEWAQPRKAWYWPSKQEIFTIIQLLFAGYNQ